MKYLFRLENVKMMYCKLKCNILLVEYRGYGRSEVILFYF